MCAACRVSGKQVYGMEAGSEALQCPGWCRPKPRAGAVLGEAQMSRVPVPSLCCSCHLAAAPYGSVLAFPEEKKGENSAALLCIGEVFPGASSGGKASFWAPYTAPRLSALVWQQQLLQRKVQKSAPGSDAVTGPGRVLKSLGGGLGSGMKCEACAVLPASSSRSHLSPCTGRVAQTSRPTVSPPLALPGAA